MLLLVTVNFVISMLRCVTLVKQHVHEEYYTPGNKIPYLHIPLCISIHPGCNCRHMTP